MSEQKGNRDFVLFIVGLAVGAWLWFWWLVIRALLKYLGE